MRSGGGEKGADGIGEGVGGVEVGIDGSCAAEEGREGGGEGVDGKGVICIKDVGGGGEAGARTGPLFFFGIFGSAEEVEGVVPVGGAGAADDGDGVLLDEAGEVEEVGFLPVGEEDGAGAVLEVGGGEDDGAVFGEGACEGGAAVGVLLGGDAGGDLAGLEDVRVSLMHRLAKFKFRR